MDLLNSFSTGIVLEKVEKFSKEIQATGAFQYFSQDDTKAIKEYKDFETILIASVLTVMNLNINLNDEKQKKDIQIVYLGKSAPFLRKILYRQYKMSEFAIDEQYSKLFFKNNSQALLNFKIHVKFDKYLKEVQKSLKDGSPYYILKYSKPQIDFFTGEETSGETWVYNYILHVLLAEETIDYEDEDFDNNNVFIGYKAYVELNQQETELLKSFVDDLNIIYLNSLW